MNDEVRAVNGKTPTTLVGRLVAFVVGRSSFIVRTFLVRRDVHASEGGAVAAAAAAAAEAAVSTPVGALMAGHVLRDGELVLLILRPSKWFILLSSLKFLAIVTIFAIFGVMFDEALHLPWRRTIEAG